MKLLLTEETLRYLDDALARSIDDVEAYLRDGKPDDDFCGDDAGLADLKAMPDRWLELRRALLKLESEVSEYADTYRARAKAEYHEEGVIEVDDGAEVSVSNDGAYVEAWLWVSAGNND